MVKRIYASGDCKVDISQYKDIVDGYSVVKVKFFTTAINVAVIKDNIEDYTVNLEWDELRPLGKGMLQFVLFYSNDDSAFNDGSYDQTDVKTTDFYIVSDITVEDNTATDVDVVMAEVIQENLNEVNAKVANVYTKDETYSKDEVDELIEGGGGFIPSDYYDKEDIDGIVDNINEDFDNSLQNIDNSLQHKQDMLECEEDGVYFTNESGEVFFKYDDEGIDANKVSDHFKELVKDTETYYDNMKKLEIPLLDSTAKTLEIPDIKYSAVYSFYGNVDTFGELVIYRSNPTSSLFVYAGTTIAINTTNIVINDGGTETVYTHGLTIADFLMVDVIVETAINSSPTFENKVQIILVTSSGVYRTEHTGFKGCMGDLKVAMTNGQMSNCVLSWSSCDLEKDVWLFGDSYLDYWVRFALQYGANNMLVDGHSGRGCASAISSLQKLLGVTHPPKTIIWAMGMNNKDNTTETGYTINSQWLETFQELESICEENDIELYVCTIPNALPSADNSYKNAYIRATDYKVIDICETLGADDSIEWYSDFRGANYNIHPSVSGSKVIAAKIIQCVPKIIKN